MRKHRTQLLLEPEQHRDLTRLAREQSRSMSEVVRDIVADYLVRRTAESGILRRQKALEKAGRIRRALRSRLGAREALDVVALIREVGQARDDRNLENVFEDRDEDRH